MFDDMQRYSQQLFTFLLISIAVSTAFYFFIHSRAVVDLALSTSAATTFKIYWADSQEPFSENRSSKIYLHPDKTEYSLRIGNIAGIEKIRIDTSDRRPATLVISHVRISQPGYETLVFDSENDFKQFQVGGGIRDIFINENGLQVLPDTNDPQLFLDIPQRVYTRPYLALSVGYISILILVGLVLLLFDVGTTNFEFVPYLIFFVLALTTTMAVITKNNRHPDEYVHVAAAQYYRDHVAPPQIGSEVIKDSYSVYGFSRLHTGEIAYLVAGTYLRLLEPFHINKYQAARSFNLLLLFILFVLTLKREAFRIFMLPVLISPQVWYVFSYFNSDAFALFITLLACYVVVNPQSIFHKYIDNGLESQDWVYLFISAALFACLLLTKKNFYFFILFLFLYFIWAVIFKVFKIDRAAFIRIGFVVITGIGLFLTYWGADYLVNNFDRQQKLEMAQEKYAREEFKPNTPIEQKHSSLSMKDRGVSLREIVVNKRCLQTIFNSSFGKYGYTSITASNGYYEFLLINVILMTVLVGSSIVMRGGLSTTILLGIVVFVSALLILVVVLRSWSIDFQPQGRYLLPVIGMIAVLLHHSHRIIPRSLFNLLLGSMYLSAVYNFVSVGLTEIEKYCG